MSEKLRRWCDWLLEGGWLLAVVLVTLYFNIYTKDSRIFEPQKALVLRTLVTLMLGVWAIRTLEETRLRLQAMSWWRTAVTAIVVISAVVAVGLFILETVTWEDPLVGMARTTQNVLTQPADSSAASYGQRVLPGLLGMIGTTVVLSGLGLAIVGAAHTLRDSWRQALRTVMVIPALVYVAVHLIATIGSVFPRASLYGGYVRQQGTLTVAAYVGLFFILAFNLRRREQVERLITVILLSSIPAALYGVVQRFGIDPLPWLGNVEQRVASTMGNAIFIAAYLIMMLPLTGYRLLSAWKGMRESPSPQKTPQGWGGIPGPAFRWLLWGGIALVLVLVFIVRPISISVEVYNIQQQNPTAISPGQQLWAGYADDLKVFAAVAALTLALPALLYTAVTWIRREWRAYAHLAGMALALAGAGALLFISQTRTNGFGWAGYLAALCGLTLLARWQNEREPWGSDALWSGGIYILIVFQNLFLFLAIQAYLPSSPYPTKWPLYLIALVFFWASCFAVLAARVQGRVGYLSQLVGYAILLCLQLTCIILTQSRGPLTGLLAGIFAFILIWAWRRRIRWALVTIVVLAVLGGAFLALFNLPDTPLIGHWASENRYVASFVEDWIEPLKEVPYLGRLGRVFDASEGTGKVRILIWFGDEIGEGSAGMIKAHPLRTLIGYGPEAMHVAYNPYYPPELAHVEKRNASPDRAHDAIIDELVTMGVIGLAGYLLYFITFFVLVWQLLRQSPDFRNQALSVGLLSLGVAHFVETVTGIPIVATRMFMWLAIGVAVALTFMPPFRRAQEPSEAAAEDQGAAESPRESARRGRRRARRRQAGGEMPSGWVIAYVTIALAALIFAFRVHIRPMRADILFWRSQQMQEQAAAYREEATQADEEQAPEYARLAVESAEDSLQSMQRAISLMPGEDFYYLSLAQLYLVAAQEAASAQEQAVFFESTERAIGRARDLSPLNTDHYRNLSALYEGWFRTTRDPDILARSIAYGEQAISLTRNNAELRNRLARVYVTAATTLASLGGNEGNRASYEFLLQAARQQGLDWLASWEEFHLTSGGRAGDTHQEWVTTYRQQAQELLDAGQVEQGLLVLAAAELQYSLFLDDQYAETYLILGDLYRDMDMTAEAAVIYGAGIRLEPKLLSRTLAGMTASVVEERVSELVQAGETAPLIAGYQAIVEEADAQLEQIAPSERRRRRTWDNRAATAYQALGYLYGTQGENEAAIQYYELALEHSETIEAHQNLALFYQQVGQYDQAIAHAEAARLLAVDRGRTSLAENLQAFIQQMQQQQQQLQQQQGQLEQLEAQLAANPEDYQAHYQLAGLYRDAGRLEDAVAQAQLAAQYVPSDDSQQVVMVNNRLGNLALVAGEVEEAEAAFLRVVEADGTNYNGHFKLALIFQDQGRIEEAITHAEAALENADSESRRNDAQALLDELR